MAGKLTHRMLLATVLLIVALPISAEPVTATTSDGITIYGDTWFGELGEHTPLVLLFHQGGGNARGEYPAIAQWLNDHGVRAIAWDLRSGGELFGARNRTVDSMPADTAADYCDGLPDVEAALDYVVDRNLAEQVIVWGSSYTGALVFQLAALRPTDVDAVIAFSPASGGPMQACMAAHWLDDVKQSIAVFVPMREMEYPHVAEQATLLMSAGALVNVVENGVHGSSMLLDERTQHDMQCPRQQVLGWIGALRDGDDRE